jgi:hypothetical protein
MIFLAMEAHEEGSDQKGQKLVQMFKNYFSII